jgi:hypothetical protein
VSELAPAAARQRVDRIKTLVGAARADIIESYRQHDWIALGYDSWDALCSAEFGTVLRLSIEDRQQAVSELRGAGMSPPAIASALGVGEGTVRRDIAGSPSGEPDRTIGQDGKSYPAKVSRPPKVEDAAPRDPAPDESSQRLRDYIESDPDVRAARLRKHLSSFIARIHAPLPDPAEMAGIAPEMEEDVMRAAAVVAAFAEKYQAALPKPTPLRAVKES